MENGAERPVHPASLGNETAYFKYSTRPLPVKEAWLLGIRPHIRPPLDMCNVDLNNRGRAML